MNATITITLTERELELYRIAGRICESRDAKTLDMREMADLCAFAAVAQEAITHALMMNKYYPDASHDS